MTAARVATRDELRELLRHRQLGAARVTGRGLEIGALHYPLALPPDAAVEYLDVEDSERLGEAFPELAADPLVAPHHHGDIVRATVPAITGRRFDFVIMNHVLEHVANPIQALANAWEGLVAGGDLVLAVPDKHFTFDRGRALTTWDHLVGEYFRGVTEVEPDHYVDFLAATLPEVFADRDAFAAALARAVRRREHVHVWDSASFRAFWDRAVRLLGLDARIVYESTAATNHFEYFAVIRKAPAETHEDEPLRVLAAVYRGRRDLQRAFPIGGERLAVRLLDWATTDGATIDSDGDALRPFQAHYRRLLERGPGDGRRLEETVREALAAP